MKSFTTILIVLFFSSVLYSQETINFRNPSFEGEAQQGTKNTLQILDDWENCQHWNGYKESPFDIHTQESNIWSVKHKPSDGKSFIGLVVRETESYESMTQELNQNLKEGNCYSFKIDLSKTDTLLSQVLASKGLVNFDGKTKLRVFGGSTSCEDSEYLFQTKVINHIEWQTYDIRFKVKKDVHF